MVWEDWMKHWTVAHCSFYWPTTNKLSRSNRSLHMLCNSRRESNTFTIFKLFTISQNPYHSWLNYNVGTFLCKLVGMQLFFTVLWICGNQTWNEIIWVILHCIALHWTVHCTVGVLTPLGEPECPHLYWLSRSQMKVKSIMILEKYTFLIGKHASWATMVQHILSINAFIPLNRISISTPPHKP